MVQRLTYRRRHAYNTRSNQVKVIRTPGGKLAIQYRKKLAKGVKCGDCGTILPGIAHLRPTKYARISRRQKNVSRSYGGNRCSHCVRDRIVRAFLIEEQKIVKRVLKAQSNK
eukprot:TRINITY_DN2853_c0_g2_i1.p1 TRINITY_DN2853_c0_g2~~TRINITY_DN2853_c0_g2_i1.p1  ORF type:complete len:120 (-),score=16.34 TRINITY_DN2853_c0_g2_i1:220-555(-)